MTLPNDTDSVRLSQDVAEDLLILLRRISIATHHVPRSHDVVNPEKVLYGFFRGAHAHTDLVTITSRLRAELTPQLPAAQLRDADHPDIVWPPPYTQPLPTQPDDDAVVSLASRLSRQQLHFGILASLNGFTSAYRTLAGHGVTGYDDTDRLESVMTAQWELFWANFFNTPVSPAVVATGGDHAWLAPLAQAAQAAPESLGGNYLRLIVPALHLGLTALEKPTPGVYVQLTRAMLEVSVLGADNESLNPDAVVFVPGMQGYERPACRLVWDDIRWIARDMLRKDYLEEEYRQEYEDLEEGDVTVTPLSDSYTHLGGAIGLYVSQPGDSPAGRVESTDPSLLVNQAACADYEPGDMVLPRGQALQVYSRVVTMCNVVGRILAEYEGGDFSQEYFFRVGWCEEYGRLWQLYYDVDALEQEYWPQRCRGQSQLQLQMSGEFIYDWCRYPDLAWWGGYRDPEPLGYCSDCDPDGLY